jgi:MATE family multidrug resistance protein
VSRTHERIVTHGALEELRVLARLAAPVALAQVGFMTMGLVDMWFVGKLGAVELAAVALADALFFTFLVVALGMIRGLEPLASQAHGAGNPQRVAVCWRAGRLLGILLTPPLVVIVLAFEPALNLWAQHDPTLDRELVTATLDYLFPRMLGILPGLWFNADRSLLYALGSARPAMVVMILANVVNAFLDWVFIFGKLGMPALGVAGSALTTSCSRWFMWGMLAWWISRPHLAPYRDAGGLSRRGPLRELFRLGLPNGLAAGLEVSAFAGASVLMTTLGVISLASHQVAIKMASTSFMIALAIGTATSIRVGQAIGARDTDGASRSGWVGIGAGTACMGLAGLAFLLWGEAIVGTFANDPAVIELGASLLVIAAAFQISDGAQAIAAGAIRGCGDTTSPFLAGLVAYWGVGLPVGAYLVTQRGAGPHAVWWSLASGLTLAAVILVARFRVVKDRPPLDAKS